MDLSRSSYGLSFDSSYIYYIYLIMYVLRTKRTGCSINTLRPRQDGRHFADDIFMCNFFNENCCILIKFSRKYFRKGPIDNNRALVQIMAWRRSGDKPLSEPIMINLPTHICVTRPQWVNIYSHDKSKVKIWKYMVSPRPFSKCRQSNMVKSQK